MIRHPRKMVVAWIRLALMCWLAVCVVGCAKKGPAGDIDLDNLPSYAALAEIHNARAALLETMYAYGAVEIRWTDDKGNHFEQGDLDVWLRMPDRVAMQIGKAGERFFWLGGNNEASWFFDVRKPETSFAELHDPSEQVQAEGDVPIAVSMTALLEMMGLAAIPAEPPTDAPPIGYDEKLNAWIISTHGAAGPMRLYLDTKRNLPVRVELLSAFPPPSKGGGQGVGAAPALENGAQQQTSAPPTPQPPPSKGGGDAVILFSALPLNRYEYIFMKGKSVDQFPLVPTLIDIARGDDKGSIKISVSKPVSEDESFSENYFDLEWLLAVLQPGEVRDDRSMRGGRR